MKVKFLFLTFLLLFARGCDFYSTSLWFFQENGMAGEQNPLTKFFGVGWNGLLLTNGILVAAIIFSLYYYFFKYKSPRDLAYKPANVKDFASVLYFGEPSKLYQLLYKSPKDKKIAIAHLGYIMTITVIVGSFLATFHNICQFYGFAFYDQYRDIVGRPLYVIYALIGLTAFLAARHVWALEFNKYRQMG
jgi:hypothetical protein